LTKSPAADNEIRIEIKSLFVQLKLTEALNRSLWYRTSNASDDFVVWNALFADSAI
jgi:hypothetical protein